MAPARSAHAALAARPRLTAMRLRLAAAAGTRSLVGCGATPTKVFDLSPRVLEAQAAAVPPRGEAYIGVDKPSVAGYFDRIQMATRTAGNRISIHQFEVWSDSPADLLQRVVVDERAHRFGADRVMATPVAHHVTPA